MELMEAICGRRAVRSYTEEFISLETLKRLVDAAIQAPSAINAQPWHFTIIRNQAALGPNFACGQIAYAAHDCSRWADAGASR